MLTRVIEFVDDSGNVVEREIPTTEFQVKIDGTKYAPEIVTNLEIENDGEVSRTQDQCGHTVRNKTGSGGWLVRVQGIITGNDARGGNLSLAMVRDVLNSMDTAEIRSDIISGSYEVSNIVITQSNDLVSVNTQRTEGQEKAFEFQIQFGESESE